MMVQDNLENRPVGDYPVCTVHGWTWAYAPCQYCRAEQAEARAKAWEEDALLRVKNEAFWCERAEQAEVRVKELEETVRWLVLQLPAGIPIPEFVVKAERALRGEERLLDVSEAGGEGNHPLDDKEER